MADAGTQVLQIVICQQRLKADLSRIIEQLLAAQTKYQRVGRDGTVNKPRHVPYQALFDATDPDFTPGMNGKKEKRARGCHEAALLLERLLDLTPKAADKTGWVYKSGDEWYADLRFERKHLDRARKHLAGLVKAVNQYSKRARKTVMHYQICLAELVKRLGQVLGLSVELVFVANQQIDSRPFVEIQQTPFVENQQIDSRPFAEIEQRSLLETGKGSASDSLYTSSSTKESDSTESSSDSTGGQNEEDEEDFGKTKFRGEIMKWAGELWVTLPSAYYDDLKELVKTYGGELVAATLEYGASLKKDRPRHTNWLKTVMAHHKTQGKTPADVRGMAAGDVLPVMRPWQAYQGEADGLAHEESEVAQNPTPLPVSEASPQEQTAWSMAYGQIELQLDRPSFDTFVRGIKLLRVDRAEGGDEPIYVIRARNDYIRDMLQHRLYRSIRRVLSDVLGGPVELLFESEESGAPVDAEAELA